MRWLTAVSLIATLALALGCGKDKSDAAPGATGPGSSGAATADDTSVAKQLIASGATVIDVREQDEWDEGHLPQAKLIPVGTVKQHLDEIATLAGGKDKPVVVYCKSGGRAAEAKRQLEAAGFTRVVNGGGYRKLAAP